LRSPAHTKAKAELKRFFAELPEPVTVFPADVTVMDEFVVHHLHTVMRAKPGEQVVLVDSARELAYATTLQAIDKHLLTLTLETTLPVEASSLPKVTLAVALIKEQRWDWLLQKATELGVRAFQPLLSERTVIKLSESDIPKKQDRWQAVVRSAAEQSEGLFIPKMLRPMSVSAFCENHSPDAIRILLAERGEERQSLKTVLANLRAERPVVIAIGPEGGWTEWEIEMFIQAGFTAASLGARILRSETAAIAAMAAMVYEFGQ
jgi:16S rRNA (uracil1498-N3)-methyltransferase